MNRDRDGKSKTASAVDHGRYPEQNEIEETHMSGADSEPDHHAIAARAHELWRTRGCPEGHADEDWFDAREELRAKLNSQHATKASGRGGSVQP